MLISYFCLLKWTFSKLNHAFSYFIWNLLGTSYETEHNQFFYFEYTIESFIFNKKGLQNIIENISVEDTKYASLKEEVQVIEKLKTIG